MKTLYKFDEVVKLIESGKVLTLAADEELLKKLPRGKWIGGTMPYFMSEEGGVLSHDQIQVTQFPDIIKNVKIRSYDVSGLPEMTKDYPENGVSFCLIPAGTEVHHKYAQECMKWDGFFDHPIVGWVTGVDLKDLGRVTPKVFDGSTAEMISDRALVMHMSLPKTMFALVNTVNLFKQGPGDTITFPEPGFVAKDCFVNGVRRNFAEYLTELKADSRLPLVADYSGALVNVSFQNVDLNSKTVTFYCPVFEGVQYKLAAPIGDYKREFEREVSEQGVEPVFSCNCILNYMYAELEGKKTGDIVGPMSFGEIAYMVLNQTMVYLSFEKLSVVSR